MNYEDEIKAGCDTSPNAPRNGGLDIQKHTFRPSVTTGWCVGCGLSELNACHNVAEETHLHIYIDGSITTEAGSSADCSSRFCKRHENNKQIKDTNPKDGIGATKPPLSTVPMTVVHEVGLALLEGACKYRRHNYRVYGVRASVYFDATQRHLNKWWEGEDIDKDSGLSHITKALASLFVLRDAMIQDMLNDDRPPITRPEFWAELEVKTKEVLSRFPDPKQPHIEVGESAKEQA